MNPRKPFLWKVAYLVAIGALLMPLFMLSQPATSGVPGGEQAGRPGGWLARLREKHHLSQTQLGQIDPTSETIKLATLGMRGVAADILWTKANDYQKKKDWTNLSATLEQITKLQPHFIAVWRHQAWNLSYNVSVAFDDYHEKYQWVIRGIEFLKEGVANNDKEPRLLWDLGWFIAQKIGRADEHKLYRRLFKADDDFQGSRAGEERDNWLVGKSYFRQAEELANLGVPVKGMGLLIFYSDAPMCQMNYAEALEKEGRFDEVASRAWKQASTDWYDFGQRDIPTSWGVTIHLNDQEVHDAAAKKDLDALEKLQPGLHVKIAAEKRKTLTPAQLKAVDTPLEKRTPKQLELASKAEPLLQVSHEEVARRITGHSRDAALALARSAANHEQLATYGRRERQTVNFDYWRLRAQVEQDPDAIAARKAIYQGEQAYEHGELLPAKAAYDRGLAGWHKVLDRYPGLKTDETHTMVSDLMDTIKDYRKLLEKLDEPLPKPFILQDVIDIKKQ